MRQPECYSYIVKDDCGYAPNPWGDACTLAACKPVIRRTAKREDLIIGLSPKRLGYTLVYAMVVGDIIPLEDYFHEPRFQSKKPDFSSDDITKWMGDNFYERTSAGEYIQHNSAHNYRNRTPQQLKEKQLGDIGGINALVASSFWYFGDQGKPLPPELNFLQCGRGHKLHGPEGRRLFESFATKLPPPGIYGSPRTLLPEAKKLVHLHG